MTQKEYIDITECRDDFYNDVLNILSNDGTNDRANQIIDVFDYLPSADVAPVKHGHWIEKPYLMGTSHFCSLCGSNYGMPHGIYNYCPSCGAKMEREEENK